MWFHPPKNPPQKSPLLNIIASLGKETPVVSRNHLEMSPSTHWILQPLHRLKTWIQNLRIQSLKFEGNYPQGWWCAGIMNWMYPQDLSDLRKIIEDVGSLCANQSGYVICVYQISDNASLNTILLSICVTCENLQLVKHSFTCRLSFFGTPKRPNNLKNAGT